MLAAELPSFGRSLVKDFELRHSVMPLDFQLELATDFPVRLERVRQCSRGPDPYASFREERVGRRCNRAGRFDGHPIFVRCLRRRKRRGPAHCDNRHSHCEK